MNRKAKQAAEDEWFRIAHMPEIFKCYKCDNDVSISPAQRGFFCLKTCHGVWSRKCNRVVCEKCRLLVKVHENNTFAFCADCIEPFLAVNVYGDYVRCDLCSTDGKLYRMEKAWNKCRSCKRRMCTDHKHLYHCDGKNRTKIGACCASLICSDCGLKTEGEVADNVTECGYNCAMCGTCTNWSWFTFVPDPSPWCKKCVMCKGCGGRGFDPAVCDWCDVKS